MNRIKRIVIVLTVLIMPLIYSGCATTPTGPYTTLSEGIRNPLEAQRLTQLALEQMTSDPLKAESLLHQALTADLYHGPAHNNLGVLLLKNDQLYEAANEFEWARKLMPGHPDPRMNLGLTMEKAGRIDEALDAYATSLEVYPNYIPSLQALARCQLRHERDDDRTAGYLKTIALRGETDQWRRWARELQTK